MRSKSFGTAGQLWLAAIVVAMIGPALLRAEPAGRKDSRNHRRPVYQRRAFAWHDRHDGRLAHDRFRQPRAVAPQVSSGWFQRPYPYHLDYYKMRYGGSYAPYFGNLYGPPQVVTAPPYYGPYYGGYELGPPPAYGPNHLAEEPPVEKAAPAAPPSAPNSGENLPAP